jgi:hypothetical protein
VSNGGHRIGLTGQSAHGGSGRQAGGGHGRSTQIGGSGMMMPSANTGAARENISDTANNTASGKRDFMELLLVNRHIVKRPNE